MTAGSSSSLRSRSAGRSRRHELSLWVGTINNRAVHGGIDWQGAPTRSHARVLTYPQPPKHHHPGDTRHLAHFWQVPITCALGHVHPRCSSLPKVVPRKHLFSLPNTGWPLEGLFSTATCSKDGVVVASTLPVLTRASAKTCFQGPCSPIASPGNTMMLWGSTKSRVWESGTCFSLHQA